MRLFFYSFTILLAFSSPSFSQVKTNELYTACKNEDAFCFIYMRGLNDGFLAGVALAKPEDCNTVSDISTPELQLSFLKYIEKYPETLSEPLINGSLSYLGYKYPNCVVDVISKTNN